MQVDQASIGIPHYILGLLLWAGETTEAAPGYHSTFTGTCNDDSPAIALVSLSFVFILVTPVFVAKLFFYVIVLHCLELCCFSGLHQHANEGKKAKESGRRGL